MYVLTDSVFPPTNSLIIIWNCHNLQVRPRIAEMTNAGPGVGISNLEVRFQDAELARLNRSDYQIKANRACGHKEAERTNSAIGISIESIEHMELYSTVLSLTFHTGDIVI